MSSCSLRHHIILFSGTILFSAGIFAAPSTADATHTANLPETLILSTDEYSETVTKDTLASWLSLKTRIVFHPLGRSEVEDISFCPTDRLFCDFSLPRSIRHHSIVHLDSDFDEERIDTFLDEFSGKIFQEPSDAVFAADENGKIIIATPEQTGQTLKKSESHDLLLRALRSSSSPNIRIHLPTNVTQPKISGSDRERLGLHELVGEGHTSFSGSPKNRIYNIKRALQQFENVLIAPGEEFSFVDYLGEVDGEHGYLPELVIKNNETIPEFGGGICQVSSTVFRAAIYSGLKITERRNHAYPVRYYRPYGMDATIYIPKPDLKFINNTPGYILVQSTVNGTDLTFRFFGTRDGRAVSVDGPHILQSNPDGSMKTVFSQLVTDVSGNSVINDSFWSNYKSPSLFPHPGEEPIYKEKPAGWSEKQWREYKKIHP